ncbi:MAG: PD-(D/E)XK nuclease family protein [Okeania sp. SIO3C4]|nr:PD-(D/E)XK nuclease family protein [Okeania sp. SIO3C4]
MAKYRLSQQHLNLLTTCPRKFQHLYLDNLSVPTTPVEQERLNWGSQFHLLMQQRELGLPIESLMLENQEMQYCFEIFFQAAPEILNPETQDHIILRQAEHSLSINFNGYILTVIYDLLIADIQQAQIFDWKTYSFPQNQTKLAQNWQTRLYLYSLVETSKYLPDAVSMTYWFIEPKSQKLPAKLKFSLYQQAHKKTEGDLKQILYRLNNWLKNYREKGEEFPQVQQIESCHSCQFINRCQRFIEVQDKEIDIQSTVVSTDLILSIDSIPEISI